MQVVCTKSIVTREANKTKWVKGGVVSVKRCWNGGGFRNFGIGKFWNFSQESILKIFDLFEFVRLSCFVRCGKNRG